MTDRYCTPLCSEPDCHANGCRVYRYEAAVRAKMAGFEAPLPAHTDWLGMLRETWGPVLAAVLAMVAAWWWLT